MSFNLDDFVQGQLYAGVIDPASSLFLPTVVLEQTIPLDPLTIIEDYAWKDISKVSSALPDQLCAAITGGSICTPGTAATLSMTQMQIVGLSNVTAAKPSVSGSRVTGAFTFGNATNLPAGLTVPPYLEIQGTFGITVSCCASSDGRTCAGDAGQQQVTGTFAVGFVNPALAVTLDVQSADDGDNGTLLTVTVEALTLTADKVQFAFQASGLAGPALNPLLRDAFNAAGGPTLLEAVNERLAAVRAALGTRLSWVFTGLANESTLAFAVSILYGQAVNPAGSHYLPKEIKQATNPVLDPFAAGGWDVPDVGQWYTAAGVTICGAIGAEAGEIQIQTPGTDVPLSLSGIQIAGTSNLMVLPVLTIDHTIYGLVAINAVADWPVTLTISGDFALKVSCCVSDKNKRTCTGASQSSTGLGTFQATIANATVGAAITVSSPSRDNLVATVDGMYFRCDPNAVNNKNIQISPKITSIPDGDASDWNAVAKEIFSSGPAASAIVAQIQERFNSSAVLDRLSAIATQAIQSLAASDPDLARRLLRDVAAQPRRGTQHGPGKQPGRETQAGRGTQPGRGGA